MAHTGIPQDQVAQGPVLRPRLPLSVVTKPTGAACNLDCQYCFFLSKELLYDAPRQLMSEETARVYVRELLAASPDGEAERRGASATVGARRPAPGPPRRQLPSRGEPSLY